MAGRIPLPKSRRLDLMLCAFRENGLRNPVDQSVALSASSSNRCPLSRYSLKTVGTGEAE